MALKKQNKTEDVASLADRVRSRDERRRPFYIMFQAGLAVRSAVARFGHGEGITLASYTMLSLIASQEQMTTTKLARRLQITVQSVNERLVALEKGGEICRSRSPDDARVVIFSITAKGRECLRRSERAIDRAEAFLFEGSDPQVRQAFWQFLGRLIERGKSLDEADLDS